MEAAMLERAGTWLEVCGADDIPLMEGRRSIVNGRDIAIFRLHDGFWAIDAVCPHGGGPLSDGIIAGGCVTCPLHGWRVSLATGKVKGREESVESYRLIEQDGRIFVQVPPPEWPC